MDLEVVDTGEAFPVPMSSQLALQKRIAPIAQESLPLFG